MPLKKGTLLKKNLRKVPEALRLAQNFNSYPTIDSVLLELKKRGMEMGRTTLLRILRHYLPNNHLLNAELSSQRRARPPKKHERLAEEKLRAQRLVHLYSASGDVVGVNLLREMEGVRLSKAKINQAINAVRVEREHLNLPPVIRRGVGSKRIRN